MTKSSNRHRPRSTATDTRKRLSRQKRCLTLSVYVVVVCLSLGLYALTIHALARGGVGEAHAPACSLAAPAQDTTVKIEPASISVDPGETFSVTVAIENVTDLGGFEFELTYNPARLAATDVVTGPFLGSTGRAVIEVGPTYGTGSLSYGAISLPPPTEGPNGDGGLAFVTFQATSVGTSTLHLQNVKLRSTSVAPITTDTEDGEVTVGTPPAPQVTRVVPNYGYTDEGVKQVIVEGTHFQDGATVQLAKSGESPISAPMPDVQSSTRISCTFNLGKAATGSWDVVVTNPGGQSGTLSNGFTVYGPAVAPTADSITPNWGYNNAVVHITNLAGSGFQPDTTVKLIKAGRADIAATNVVRVSAYQITCDLDLRGACPGQWTVRVTNPGVDYAELNDAFTVKRLVHLPLVLRNW